MTHHKTSDDVNDLHGSDVEQSDRELDAAAISPRTTPDEVHDALLAMIGLVLEVCDRDDVSGDIRVAMQTSPRYIGARQVAKAYL